MTDRDADAGRTDADTDRDAGRIRADWADEDWLEYARLNPVHFCSSMWPDVLLTSYQRDVLHSVRDNDETVVVAGNKLGKDFVAGLAVLHFFLSRHPCRVVTTSADGYQLEAVLWGEIRRFIQTARYPLSSEFGGPVLVNHLHLRKVVGDSIDPLSYVVGRVAAKGGGMLGHHIAPTGDGVPRTLFVADEASGVDDVNFARSETWADRRLIIGNPFPCSNHFFRAVKEGDLGVGQDTASGLLPDRAPTDTVETT